MVKAIIDGRKTQTRRIVKPQPYSNLDDWFYNKGRCVYGLPNGSEICTELLGIWDVCPYGKTGDFLWVRETFKTVETYLEPDFFGKYLYRAMGDTPDKWKPSLFMPKEAARIWLEIVDIKIERLHDIAEGDAVKEGINLNNCSGDWKHTPVQEFELLWEKINGIESWNENPFVWAISFKVLSKTGKPVLVANSV